MKEEALQAWRAQAYRETEKATDAALQWLSLFHTQLRGLATLFYGSSRVSEDEFLDALEILEDMDAATPLESFGLIQKSETREGKRLVLNFSSDTDGPWAAGTDLTGHEAMQATIQRALAQPEKVITGTAFSDKKSGQFVLFAITAPHAGTKSVLFSALNLEVFLADLQSLHIPAGLHLRLQEMSYDHNYQDRANYIFGHPRPPMGTKQTYHLKGETGGIQWTFHWDLLPNYIGGPATALGDVVQWGGSALALFFFALIGLLSRENQRVNRQVAERTAELQQAMLAAEKANLAKSTFLAHLSHEIRTPMTAILGLTEVVLESDLESEQQRLLKTVERSGDMLLALINDVLDLSKIEAGQLTLEALPFNLHGLVSDVVEILIVQAQSKGLSISCEIAPNMPMRVVGDPERLKQILFNLVGNAIKFTHHGGVVVKVGLSDNRRDGISFSISDTGVGIPKDRLSVVFQPFMQASNSVTRKFGGTGLGLSICRQLVERMDGRLQVESTEGRGSNFSFTIPLKETEDFPQAEPSLKHSADKNETLKRRRFTKSPDQNVISVLLVDDFKDNILVMESFLDSRKYQIDIAVNGREAVKKFEDHDYDLVLMDTQMPVMDGYEATRKIRIWEETAGAPRTPIIAVTANATKEDEKKSLGAGCDDHLCKPFSKKRLLEVISRFTSGTT